MAKKQEKEISQPDQPVRVLRLIRDGFGAYGWVEYEVNESALGEPKDKSLPDIFAIFINTLIPKTKAMFGI